MKYALIDTANTFFRARHVASRNTDTWEKIGMAIHLTMSSVNMIVRQYGIDHVVFCLEGRSWRKDYDTNYKANRAAARAALSPKEAEEDRIFWEAFDELKTFFNDKTNCSVLRHDNCEADDFIARVAGTNYNLTAIGEKERAIKAIQELLITGPINPEKGSAIASQELNPAEEMPEEKPEETPAEA